MWRGDRIDPGDEQEEISVGRPGRPYRNRGLHRRGRAARRGAPGVPYPRRRDLAWPVAVVAESPASGRWCSAPTGASGRSTDGAPSGLPSR